MGFIMTEQMMGIPTLTFMPPKAVKFSVSEDFLKISLPNKGRYVDLDPTFYTEEHGSFCIFEDDVFNIPDITKVMFGTRQYPNIDDNQLFCPVTCVLEGDNVVIVGRILTLE